jgi:hypothetical protein
MMDNFYTEEGKHSVLTYYQSKRYQHYMNIFENLHKNKLTVATNFNDEAVMLNQYDLTLVINLNFYINLDFSKILLLEYYY